MSDQTENDKKLVADLQAILDQVSRTRRGLIEKRFSPKGNGCVCEGTALCAHHAGVYKQLEQAADSLALAIRAAEREE